MTKKVFIFPTGKQEMTFDELYEQFFKMVQSETWKMIKKYPVLKQSEVSQQFTIELWHAYEKYDAELGYCISTYVYHRFNKARRDVLQQRFLSVKAIKENRVFSLDGIAGDQDSEIDFYNNDFSQDENADAQRLCQPDFVLEEKDFFHCLKMKLKSDAERDMVEVFLDKKNYSISDYAEKWNITRQAANKRYNVLEAKLKKILTEDNLSGK